MARAQIVKPCSAFFCGIREQIRYGPVITGHLGNMRLRLFLTVGFKIDDVKRLRILKNEVYYPVDKNIVPGGMAASLPVNSAQAQMWATVPKPA